MISSGALVGGKFRLVRRLGLGAMGEVWEAVNVDTDREVALKLITRSDPELRRRLVREARAIGRLNHPNIVQILDRGETEAGEPFLIMERLQGETLSQRLRRERSLGQPAAAGIALDIARALRVAHEKQIVHRDLKPGNIFLHREPDTEEDIVKVVDFGVSKLTVEGDQGTMTGGIVGSPAYMSPEQIRSSAVDGRTDVWALGVMLFEMLAGQRPFAGTTPVMVLGQILSQAIPRIESLAPDVSPGLGDVIAGCLERDLSLRIASAAELSRRLRPFGPRNRFATIDESGRAASLPDAPAHDGAAISPRLPPPPPSAQPPPEKAPPVEGSVRESDAPTGVFQPGMLGRAARGATGTVLMGPSPAPAPAAPGRDSTTTLYTREPAQGPASAEVQGAGERTTAKMPDAPAQALVGRVPGQTFLTPQAGQVVVPLGPPPAPPPPAPTPPDAPRRGYKGTLFMHDAPAPDPNAPVGGGTMPLDPRLIPPSPVAATPMVPPTPPPPGSWKPSASTGAIRGTLPLDGPPMALPEPSPVWAPQEPAPPSDLLKVPVSRWPTVLLLFAVVAFVTAVTLLFATLWGGEAAPPGPAGSASAPPAKTP